MRKVGLTRRLKGLLGSSLLAISFGAQAAALPILADQTAKSSTYRLDIPAQTLDTALLSLASQTNADIVLASELTADLHSEPLQGAFSLTEALDKLLAQSGLTYRINSNNQITITPKSLAVKPQSAKPALEIQKPRVIDEVMVTAIKRTTDLQKTPLAVTAFNQAALDHLHSKDVRDLTDMVPGLEMTNTGEQSALLIQLRGIGQTNITEIADGPVALHVDGVYSPRSQGAGSLLYDLENIEFLRGPQGTLFGRNATAGGINIQSKKPVFDETSGYLSGGLGSYQQESFRGTLNLPLNETFAVRIATAIDKHHAYTDLIANYAGLGPQYPARVADLNRYQQSTKTQQQGPDADNQEAVRVSSLWQPTEKLHWFLSAEHYKDTGTSVTELDPSLVERGIRATVSDTPSFLNLTNDTLRSRLDYVFDNEQTVSYIAGRAVMRREQAFDQDMGRSGNYEQRRTDSSLFRFYSHELQWMNKDSAPLRWIGGLFYSRERNNIVYAIDQADDDGGGNLQNTTSFISDFGGAATAIFVQPDRQVKSTAAYAQATYNLTDSSQLTAGIRHTRDTKSDRGGRSLNCRVTGLGPYLTDRSIGHGAPKPGDIFADSGATAAIAAGLPYDNGGHTGIGDQACWVRQVNDYSATWQNTSGLLRYEHHLDNQKMAYASVATGFKSGHIQDRGNEAKPEEVINYELGLKTLWQEGALRLNSALYQAHYTNLQYSDRDLYDRNNDGVVDAVSSTVVRNAAAASVRGLEIEADWSVSERDTLQTAITFMRAEFENFQTPDTLFGNLFNPYAKKPGAIENKIVDLSGNSPVRTPDWKLTALYHHDFNWVGGKLTPSLKATFSDEYYLDIYNRRELRAGIFASAPQGAKNLAVQKAFATWDFTLRYEPDQASWNIELFVKNLTDQNVKTSSGTFITPKGFDAIYLPPRTYGFVLSQTF